MTTECHHVFPRKFLRDSGQNAFDDSVLANFVFQSRSENNDLGGGDPKVYRAKMPDDYIERIVDAGLLPDNFWELDYATFVQKRVGLLAEEAQRLIA